LCKNFGSGESDSNFRISGWGIGVIINVSDVWIVWGKGFEDVVVVVKIKSDGVSQCFSP
jgi:hypothetical protein